MSSSAGSLDVVVVGGGVAGLACAREVHGAGRTVTVLEASDGVGGRVRTDEVDGFLLDRGFQVLLEAYPECRAALDYAALQLRQFAPGALIWTGSELVKLVDPFRDPIQGALSLLRAPGTVMDKLLVARFRQEVRRGAAEALFAGPDVTALEDLHRHGFSENIVETFFRPFFGGVFLDRDLQVSSRLFRFVFRMFSEGPASVPAGGMGSIPGQLASALPEGAVQTSSKVVEVVPGSVTLAFGETVAASAVVIATEAPEAARLLAQVEDPGSNGVTCLYFDAPEPPVRGPILVLNGAGGGPVNNLAVMSEASPTYAPPGRALVSVSVLSPFDRRGEDLKVDVLAQLAGWFGPVVGAWRHLRTYRVRHAQPVQAPGTLDPVQRSVIIEPGLFVCGDHRETATLNGAVHSGRRAAQAVLASLA